MAFFGLTQVGPQSQFHAVLLDAMDLSLFSEEEFARAFSKLDKDKSGFLDLSEVRGGHTAGSVLGRGGRVEFGSAPSFV